jgi:hypothetical protein
MNLYVIGEDKSLKDVTELVLALAGGTMEGNIAFDSGTRIGDIIRFISGDANGTGISIGDGGTTIIGGGESAKLLEPAAGGGAPEKLILANDTDITFYVNCQNGMTNAKQVTLSTAGLLSGHQKAITSGTAAPSGGSNGDIYIQY